MEFMFLGTVLPVSEKMEEYRKYRCVLSGIARNECEGFEDKYWAADSLEIVKENIAKWGEECIANATRDLVGLLIEQEIVTVSPSFLQREYDIEHQFEKPLITNLERTVEMYSAIVDNNPEEMDYIYCEPQTVCHLRSIICCVIFLRLLLLIRQRMGSKLIRCRYDQGRKKLPIFQI